MSSPESRFHSAEEMIQALRTARDSARVQAHLLSLEAREHWQELEGTLLSLQSKLEQGGERAAASAAVKVHELTQAVSHVLRGIDGAQDLQSPAQGIMTEAPATCSPGDTLSRAAQIMWDHDCGAVPVVSSDGALVGMITDRDVCMAAYTRGEPLSTISVETTMSRGLATASPDDSIGHVARIMNERQVHRVPILEDGKLVGIVALADLARYTRRHRGNTLPACLALAHTVAAISESRKGQASAAE
jgi:CBS domain-containing protein